MLRSDLRGLLRRRLHKSAFMSFFCRRGSHRRRLADIDWSSALQVIQITDLHLSDRADTRPADALRWAIDTCNQLAPDLIAFTGDTTTYGTADSARKFLDQANLEPGSQGK